MTEFKKIGLVILINLGLLFTLAFGSMATASAVGSTVQLPQHFQ
ncbi:MAG: hypothetical protein A4E53_01140 [Pelotomaculum sp. PtaB.Bin104]|nr:MAG: hypothetical protein A4E53_01140 [Pelotomaculum sp. PtaB.Bin104]